MRTLFVILDTIMITICGSSVIEDIINNSVNKVTLLPMFIFSIKIGYMIGSKFYEDYKTTAL